jgi:DNA repair protein RadC
MNTAIPLLGDYLDRLRGAQLEHLAVIHLGYRKSVIARRITSGGSIAQTPFPIRIIVADALNLGSTEIILAHNHPSGVAEPSAADLDETRNLARALTPLRIDLTDHIIITRERYYSMRDCGLL